MHRIKIDLPKSFSFVTSIHIRITDLNYGGHVGNDNVLSIIHEARVQFLKYMGFDEMNMAGVGLIMSDAAIEFKNELFYGDDLKVSVTCGEFSKVGFDIFYKLEKKQGENHQLIAVAKTGMICYNYQQKKIVSVPADAKMKLSG